MSFRGLLLCAIAASSLATAFTNPASATMRIAEDRGGQIGHYLQAFATLRSSGEDVVIDGNCLSACTLVLGLIPRQRVCATSRARFGFHAAWMPDADGTPVTSPLGTQALWKIYPSDVKRWINANGGLSRKMIFMHGNGMRGIVSQCGGNKGETVEAHVDHKPQVRSARKDDSRAERKSASRASSPAARRVRYSAVSAASDRR